MSRVASRLWRSRKAWRQTNICVTMLCHHSTWACFAFFFLLWYNCNQPAQRGRTFSLLPTYVGMPADLHFDTLATTDSSMTFPLSSSVSLACLICVCLLSGWLLAHFARHRILLQCIASYPGVLRRTRHMPLATFVFLLHTPAVDARSLLKAAALHENQSLYNNTLYSNMYVSSLE